MSLVFLVWGFLYGVRAEFIDDVSETAVGPIFNTSHTVQKNDIHFTVKV